MTDINDIISNHAFNNDGRSDKLKAAADNLWFTYGEGFDERHTIFDTSKGLSTDDFSDMLATASGRNSADIHNDADVLFGILDTDGNGMLTDAETAILGSNNGQIRGFDIYNSLRNYSGNAVDEKLEEYVRAEALIEQQKAEAAAKDVSEENPVTAPDTNDNPAPETVFDGKSYDLSVNSQAQDFIQSIKEKYGLEDTDAAIDKAVSEGIIERDDTKYLKRLSSSNGDGDYNATAGEKLADIASNGTSRTTSGGECGKYVNNAIEKAYGTRPVYNSAYQAAEILRGNVPEYADLANNFEEVSVSREDLKNLPAGAIVVWSNGDYGDASSIVNEHGHISIAMGDGTECSDFKTDQIVYQNRPYSVFIPKS